MNKQFLIFGAAVFAIALGGGVLIFALTTCRPRSASQTPAQVASPPAPGNQRTAVEAKESPLPAPSPRPPDPLAPNLFPPELIMRFQDQIGLSNEQRQAKMTDMQNFKPKFEQIQQQMREEQAALVVLLNQERVDLEPSLAQAEKVQALEREMKRTQLTLLIGLKNRLSAEQQAQLLEIQAQQGPAANSGANAPRTLQEKVQRLQAGIQQWQQNGWDPSAIGQTMQPFEALMRTGQFKEAEAVLDDALKLLSEGKPPR